MSRPLFLLGGVLVYALGAGVARYLGIEIQWWIYLLGQAYVTTMQLSAHYLNEYFDSPADQHNPNRTIFSGGSGAVGEGKLSRNTVLLAALTTLTILASLTVLLLQTGQGSPLVVLVISLMFLGSFFYSSPPIRLVSSGYGELTTSIIVANLVPIFAFLLQYGDFHRLLALTTFPLTAIHMAMMVVFEFPDYATDIKFNKKTLLVRMGWERGMDLHNSLILGGFLLIGIAASFNLPLPIALPAFLPLPLGLFQIWQLRRISDGMKPNWRLLGLTSVALFASVTYLFAFTYWTR
jgi:1,4-dihydroxy-2-naphthoate octaprenyltransferase